MVVSWGEAEAGSLEGLGRYERQSWGWKQRSLGWEEAGEGIYVSDAGKRGVVSCPS